MTRGYEDNFGPALEQHLRNGDVVWDVDANLGVYTKRFLDAVGSTGKVVAFEPTSECFSTLTHAFSNSTQAVLMNVAPGDRDGTVKMTIEAGGLAATHRIAIADGNTSVVSVVVRSASSIVLDDPTMFPNVVKVDVEGHEGAVLDGFHGMLSDARLRCIGIEMHFGLLAARGESHRPGQMEELLLAYRFKLHWTDSSHIICTR